MRLDLYRHDGNPVYSDGQEVPVNLGDVKVDGYDKDGVGTRRSLLLMKERSSLYHDCKAKDEGGNQGGDQAVTRVEKDLNKITQVEITLAEITREAKVRMEIIQQGGQDSGSADQGVVQNRCTCEDWRCCTDRHCGSLAGGGRRRQLSDA